LLKISIPNYQTLLKFKN